ncbi:MAG TPA: cation-transporting P-type ATPase [Solirubrobacterales bacterium]|nr:cation-transporting P-type ATPase [Solirubrobacterales bacterium]
MERSTVEPRVGALHALAGGAAARAFGTDPARGLRASEVAARQRRFGPNALPEPQPPSAVALVARQFRDAIVLLLVGAASVSLALGELLDGAVIASIVVVNALLGAVQEGRAETAARAVRTLLSPTAIVVRDGAAAEVDATELVPGDVVVLSAGDRVPADGRLLEAARLEINESAMTGESVPAAKRAEPPAPRDASPADRVTMALSGTTVTRGSARLLVGATGTRTELARIAEAASGPRPVTPLQERLDGLARTLLRAAIVICLALAALSYVHGESLGTSLLIGVSLAVAAVPEGLAAVVTITLALGMRSLAQRGAIVRRLRAVETLGSATVICTDKTGTLTTNRMTVARLLPADRSSADGEHGLLAAALIASGDFHDPGEAAIAEAAEHRGLRREDLLTEIRVVGGEPFDSERKRMSVVVENGGDRAIAYVKGAPEALLARLSDQRQAARLGAEASRWAEDAIRVLMVARTLDLDEGADPEAELEPLGLIGLVDPVREGAGSSVETAREAGIRTIMITGDHPETAVAVARACGIGPDSGPPSVVTGPELDALSDSQLRERIPGIDVFARVVPEHKSRIVAALQSRSEVVGMTGDGVNDAPALSSADIGVAMGRGGSDAAIEAAEIVLTDNSFSTLIAAVEGGRRIYANILRFINFLLAANAGEVLLFALAVLPGLGAPLTIAQILLVNLLTDGLPAVALGVDPADKGAMRKPPRPRSHSLLGPLRSRLVVGGLATGTAAFAAFLIGNGDSHETGQTMAFATVLFAQLGFVYAVRGEGLFLRAGRNRALDLAVAISALVGGLALALPPVADAFGVVELGAAQLAAALALAALPFIATELVKWVRRRGAEPVRSC